MQQRHPAPEPVTARRLRARTWGDVGATLVVALLPADIRTRRRSRRPRFNNPVRGTPCANRATTRVAPTAGDIGGRRLRAPPTSPTTYPLTVGRERSTRPS